MDHDEEAARSAGQTAYYIPEVRAGILRQLDKAELVCFMRVEKGCMAEVSRELYRDISYQQCQRLMKMKSPSGAIYRNSVKTIDARSRSLVLTGAIRRAYSKNSKPEVDWGENGDGYSSEEDPLDVIDGPNDTNTYNPRLVNIIMIPLLKSFLGLRQVLFGAAPTANWGDHWNVHLHPRYKASHNSPSIGHVNLVTRLVRNIHRDLKRTLPPALPPSSDYTLSERYNLSLSEGAGGDKASPALCQQWLNAIRDEDHPLFSRLYEEVNFDVLPIDLADIAKLYERQAQSGHTLRLQAIVAPKTRPFDLQDFGVFTRVMSNLVVLALHSGKSRAYRESAVSVSFSDLPVWRSMIRKNLPNLSRLDIAVKGIETAETVCRDVLSAECLDERGTLESLDILTANHSIPLFNTVRCLAPLCRTTSAPSVGPRYDRSQGEFLEYLCAQSAQSRQYLATVDFADLDIANLQQASVLQYYPDGRPQRMGETLINQWLFGARHMLDIAQNRAIAGDNHLSFVRKYLAMLERLQVSASTATSEAMLDGMLDLSGSIRRMVRATHGGWEIPGRELRENTQTAIGAFVEVMRTIVEGKMR